MIQRHDVEQGSEEWLELRLGKYTGSNAFKLLTGHPDRALNQESTFTGSFATERGHLLESEAIELYEAIKAGIVDRIGFITNDLYPSAGYSPDGIFGETLIEVKCFFEKNHSKLLNGEIDMKIQAQVQFGMMVCELSVAHLIAYNPKMEAVEDKFKIIRIERNENIISNFERILG